MVGSSSSPEDKDPNRNDDFLTGPGVLVRSQAAIREEHPRPSSLSGPADDEDESATTLLRAADQHPPKKESANSNPLLNQFLNELSFWEPSSTSSSKSTTTANHFLGVSSVRMKSPQLVQQSQQAGNQSTTSNTRRSSAIVGYRRQSHQQQHRESSSSSYNNHYLDQQQSSQQNTSTLKPGGGTTDRYSVTHTSKKSKDSDVDYRQELEEEEHDDLDVEEKKIEPTRVWKTAVDPATGRTYYYDAVSRQTQWEKPEEVRNEERRVRREKRRLDQLFFEQVKQNILTSLHRGELIPGIPREQTTQQGPPLEPINNFPSKNDMNMNEFSPASVTALPSHQPTSSSQQQSSQSAAPPPIRIRTISGMNETVLAELHQHPTTGTKKTNSAGGVNHTNHTNNSTNNPRPSTTVSRPSAVTSTSHGSSNAGLVEGRPPLPQRGRSVGNSTSTAPTSNNSNAGTATTPSLASNGVTQPSTSSSSVDYCGSVYNPNSGMTVIPLSDTGGELLQGEHLLDGPIWDNNASGLFSMNDELARQWMQQPQQPQSQQGPAESKPPSQVEPSATSTNITGTPSPAHIRRNTGGTVFVRSTMENPNIDATIKCVCGVYRAHIVQAASRGNQDATPTSSSSSFAIFRDEPAPPSNRGPLASRMPPPPTPPIPSLEDIESFYHDFYRRSQMEHDTIIMSLIYVERLIKETNGALTPSPYNWKSILFSCMVLSSKVWDDLSMFNLDFSNVSMSCGNPKSGLSAFSLQRTNALELAVLQTLNFNVRVAASEYAKYYFLIRTMLIRSGLLDERGTANSNQNAAGMVPLNANTTLLSPGGGAVVVGAAAPTPGGGGSGGDGGQLLENRTSKYQDALKRRARSVDWTTLGPSSNEPVLQDSVCLEQLLLRNNQR